MALAMAVEKSGLVSSIPRNAKSSTDLASLGVSPSGSKLLEAIKNTKFHGVTGEFQLVDGQLQSSAFQIVNVNGKSGRGIGFWTSAKGLSRHLNSSTTTPTVMNLKPIIWPGESAMVPKGWQTPTNGKKLRIGVPIKQGFNQFVNVERDPITNISTVTGFCIDVFEAVIKMMPYSVPYEYVPQDGASAGAYDRLVDKVYLEELDAVVGDVTILRDRSKRVDFSLPYTESGVAMLVPAKDQYCNNSWMFLNPLTTNLWLVSLTFFIFTGLVVWVLERRINDDYQVTLSRQLGLAFYFTFCTLVFAHKDRIVSNLSKLVVVIWVFVVLILTASYTASLTSRMTVKQLKPTVIDMKDLVKNRDSVGYQDGSFVLHLLERVISDKEKLKNLSHPEAYADALSKGSHNSGVAAIIDEIPYLKLFFSVYCTNYTVVTLPYKTAGFGFVFPRGSPLLPDISRAVLNVTQSDTMKDIERKWFADPSICPSKSDSFITTKLDSHIFGGLFFITGVVSLLSLFIFFAGFFYREWKELRAAGDAAGGFFWKRLKAWAMYFNEKDKRYDPKEEEGDVVIQDVHVNDPFIAALNDDGSQTQYSDLSDVTLGAADEGMSTTEPGTIGAESPLPEASSSNDMIVEHQD